MRIILITELVYNVKGWQNDFRPSLYELNESLELKYRNKDHKLVITAKIVDELTHDNFKWSSKYVILIFNTS